MDQATAVCQQHALQTQSAHLPTGQSTAESEKGLQRSQQRCQKTLIEKHLFCHQGQDRGARPQMNSHPHDHRAMSHDIPVERRHRRNLKVEGSCKALHQQVPSSPTARPGDTGQVVPSLVIRRLGRVKSLCLTCQKCGWYLLSPRDVLTKSDEHRRFRNRRTSCVHLSMAFTT